MHPRIRSDLSRISAAQCGVRVTCRGLHGVHCAKWHWRHRVTSCSRYHVAPVSSARVPVPRFWRDVISRLPARSDPPSTPLWSTSNASGLGPAHPPTTSEGGLDSFGGPRAPPQGIPVWGTNRFPRQWVSSRRRGYTSARHRGGRGPRARPPPMRCGLNVRFFA